MLHGCEITSFLSLFLSLSVFLFPLVIAVLWPSPTLVFGTVHHSICTPLHYTPFPSYFAPAPLSLSRPSSSSSLSVVYQDGFYGAADLYVSKLTSHRHALPVPPLTPFSCSFFSSGGDCACASSHGLHRAACIKVNEPTMKNSLQAQHATNEDKMLWWYKVLSFGYFFVTEISLIMPFEYSFGQNRLQWLKTKKRKKQSCEILMMGSRVSNTTTKAALWADAAACISVRVCEHMNKSVCVYPGWQRLFLFSL